MSESSDEHMLTVKVFFAGSLDLFNGFVRSMIAARLFSGRTASSIGQSDPSFERVFVTIESNGDDIVL